MAGQKQASKRSRKGSYESHSISDASDSSTETPSTGIQPGLKHENKGVQNPYLRPNIKKSGGKGAADWLSMLVALMFGTYLAYRYQTEGLPTPLLEKVAGVRGFSEERAYRHVKALTALGPHPVGTDTLQRAVQYVLDQAFEIQETAHPEAELDVDHFHARPGLNRLDAGLFKGKSLVYSGLKHVVVRVRPKYEDSPLDNAILVSSHIDTVFSAEGAGDCSSCVGVMLELLRALSQWGQGFKHSVIFLFNTGEEEGLNGAHSFMTQHPWRNTIRAAVDLEAMGAGGKHFLFQGGPDSWLVEIFAKVAKSPATMMLSQDIFYSGLIKSATDFQIYREVSGLSGLDFAYMDNSAVYHTRNDKLALVRPGSLQHSGDNLLPFLREVATLPDLGVRNLSFPTGFSKMEVVYFDLLGFHMLTYSQDFAKLLHHSIIYQLVVLHVASVFLIGIPALIASCLAFLTIYLTWCFALGFTLLVAMIVPYIGTFSVPFIASPWLAVPLYGIPAVIGALLGHYFGHMLLVMYLLHIHDGKQRKGQRKSDQSNAENALQIPVPATVEWEAERWLFKAGIMQWVLVLAVTTWLKAGSSYLALAWVLGPTVAYGLLETQLSPRQSLRELKYLTFWLGVSIPTVLMSLPAIRFPLMLINILVSFDRNPGALPEWLGSVMVGVLVAVICTLMLIFLLPYVYRSSGLPYILGALGLLLLATLGLVALDAFPAFTPNIGRGINLVHIIDTDVAEGDEDHSQSYISLSSVTMGNLNREVKLMGDKDLVCGRSNAPDFANYVVKYGCQKQVPVDESLWNARPMLTVVRDEGIEQRKTTLQLNTGDSLKWFLAINSDKVDSFMLEAVLQDHLREVLVPANSIVGVAGWHQVQYTTDIHGPSDFLLSLYWSKNSTGNSDPTKILKLRTDVRSVTTETAKMFEKLPDWCVSFGKSTSPLSLAYLASLTI